MIYGPVFFAIVGLILFALVGLAIWRYLKPDHRLVRKRRKNYGKVITRAKRPVVMLNVKTGK